MNESKRSRVLLAGFGVLCTAALVAASLHRLGLPLTLYTWIAVATCAASGATLALHGARSIAVFTAALATCLYLAVPFPFQRIPGVEAWTLFDDVGGRSGWAITPGLRFGTDGPNTALLETYVGPLEPNWWHQAPHSPYIRDGNERVQSRSVIRCEYFPGVLEMLPDDDARRTVIRCLTDPENRLRVHQGLLLTCLYVLQFPPGTDRETWWTHHKDLFQPQYDSILAASLTQDWLDSVERSFLDEVVPDAFGLQLRAASYQEQGTWGAHSDFGEAFMEMQRGQRQPEPRALEMGRRVTWWLDAKA